MSMCEDMEIEELLFIVPKALKLLAVTEETRYCSDHEDKDMNILRNGKL